MSNTVPKRESSNKQNNIPARLRIENSAKISTYFSITTSLLVAFATLGIAFYAIYFVNDMFGYLVAQEELLHKTILFKRNLERLVFMFLVMGLVASYYMTKTVTEPLLKLIKDAQRLANGDLKHRFRRANYLEINELIKTFNIMAENLQTLYNELEEKVKDRTRELEIANKELKSTQAIMVHSEKMRSLGQLVAGITHEINNPINFIYGNMTHLKNYTHSLFEIIDCYETMETNITDEQRDKIKALKEELELDFIKEDLPSLIKSCQEGTERTKNIILDLKNFSRLDEMTINSINLENEIDTTLNILRNKIKNKINIVKEYEPNIPQIEGYGGQLNQVFMNILDNACYAVENSDSSEGKIYIRLKNAENGVIIEFEDTGSGMNKEQIEKIFEPFYTTKPVGKGSGMGMSISYKVIKNHSGDIRVESELGKGSKFTIQLPLEIPKTETTEKVSL